MPDVSESLGIVEADDNGGGSVRLSRAGRGRPCGEGAGVGLFREFDRETPPGVGVPSEICLLAELRGSGGRGVMELRSTIGGGAGGKRRAGETRDDEGVSAGGFGGRLIG